MEYSASSKNYSKSFNQKFFSHSRCPETTYPGTLSLTQSMLCIREEKQLSNTSHFAKTTIWNSIASVATEDVYTFLFDGTKFHQSPLFFFFFSIQLCNVCGHMLMNEMNGFFFYINEPYLLNQKQLLKPKPPNIFP